MQYTVSIEKGENSFGAYVRDLPGCVAIGETQEEVLRLIQEAIEFISKALKMGAWPFPSHDFDQFAGRSHGLKGR